jgi:hypothetical protein
MQTTLMTDAIKPLRRRLYLGLTLIGTVLPWVFFDQFLFSGTASVEAFFAQAFANPVARLCAADLIISALTFFGFTWFELKRSGLSRSWLWLYAACTFGAGLSCALPLFLYLRERQG